MHQKHFPINYQTINGASTRDAGRLISLKRQHDRAVPSKKSELQQTWNRVVGASLDQMQRRQATVPNFELPDLPVNDHAASIIAHLQQHQVLILAGETGSGKTTQLPKLCLQAGLGLRGQIGHTQPRRVAATSVASRIAEELKVNLGEQVGVAVRFYERYSDDSLLKVMTDGILLSEIQRDRFLSKYEVIIIDEAHERSINIDFLLGYLKQLLPKRKDLKVIVTSATIDAERFGDFFNDAKVMTVEGRTYPVAIEYLDPAHEQTPAGESPELFQIPIAVKQAIKNGPGDILVFLPGEGEIRQVANQLRKLNLPQTKVLPLYARLSIAEQQKVFKPVSGRKIVLSTNVAETSLTVPGIKYVIDPGTARISRFSMRSKIQRLPIEKISQASAKQRAGRCGRVSSGICYRLYSEQDFDNRAEFTLPEIRRTNLASVILQMKSMGIDDLVSFPFIETPHAKHWQDGLQLLTELGAIDQQQQLTERGKQIARLPVDPKLAVMLVGAMEPVVQPSALQKNNTSNQTRAAAKPSKQEKRERYRHPCLNEMLIIASLFSVRDPRERPHHARQKADQLHQQWADKRSDFISFINLWNRLHEHQEALSNREFKQFCADNMINFVAWLEWRNTYRQLKQLIVELGVQLNSQPADADTIHRALMPALLSNIICKTKEIHYQGARNSKVFIHPSSVSFKAGSQWMMAAELIETERLYARTIAPIETQWIEECARSLSKETYLDVHWRKQKGEACAYLQLSLYGLIYVSQRLVSYGRQDTKLSRQWLIEKGLIDGEIVLNAPFHSSNQALLNQYREEETRQRRADILKSEEELVDWFDQRLPESVFSRQTLVKWLKKNNKTNNKRLSLTEVDVLQPESELDEMAFPKSLKVRGSELSLDYRFEPGHDDDGVSVCIPLPMINQFHPSDFSWLVPGLVEEKILHAIRSLPKRIRKNFIPAPEYAKACFERIAPALGEGDFYQTLAEKLEHISGVVVDLEEWKSIELPAHLVANFKIFDQGKQPIAKGRNLEQLQTQLKQKVKQSLQQVAEVKQTSSSVDKTGHKIDGDDKRSSNRSSNQPQMLTAWPNDMRFEIELASQQRGHQTRLMRALSDNTDSVTPVGCESLFQAQVTHLRGVARLLVLSEDKTVKYFIRSWQQRRELQRLATLTDNYQRLVDQVALAIAKQQLLSNAFFEKPIIDYSQYEVVQQHFSEVLSEQMNQQLTQLLAALTLAQKISKKVYESVEPKYLRSYQDIRFQLDRLLQPGFVYQFGIDRVSHYQRYFNALEKRIERMGINFPREQQLLTEIRPTLTLREKCQEQPHNRDYTEALFELDWMIEEWRISLFAQGNKTIFPISEKRLKRQFERLAKLV